VVVPGADAKVVRRQRCFFFTKPPVVRARIKVVSAADILSRLPISAANSIHHTFYPLGSITPRQSHETPESYILCLIYPSLNWLGVVRQRHLHQPRANWSISARRG
jgi:hypothetical protein